MPPVSPPRPTPAVPVDPGGAFGTLVRWSTTVTWGDLPEDVRRRAVLVLADDLGAMLAVRHDPQVAALRDTLVRPGQAPEARVIAGGGLRG
ncbi:hypothetical protein ACVU7I_02065, partial [Patulibacter sp. S7RM1-6]